ncbi:hypothetical protein BST81_03530 [Leptolyngbya sp. 'hensonii']|uniref:hypothetical protein n=1 Tax=Leptolyngbya sp. 'hensonii' TaxID=1922337 RepID=UPI00094F5BF9|nr:hypothetical protein [Leptolyngbya sp. 'hensonii']OLP19814.1 hypothetical protein BST81_03530 [Leptolyngbya sp. 'hensonii']
MNSSLILPGTLEFVLASQSLPPPPGWREEAHQKSGEVALIAPLGQSGLLEVVPMARAWEYAVDGELDARQEELQATAVDEDPLIWRPGN